MGVRSGPRIVNREAPLLVNESLDDWSGDNPVGWTVATESAGVYYVNESSGAARMVTDGTWMSFHQNTTRSITGKRCRISFDVVAISGTFKVEGTVDIYRISNAPAMSAGNRYTIEFTADSDLIRFSRYSGALDVTIDNISLVCIHSPSPLVLCLEAGTKGSVIAGDDIITGDDVTFSSDTGNWLDGGNWTISGGTASCTADGSNHYLDYNFAAVTGQKYKLTFETVSNSISNLGHVVVQGGVVANSAVNFEPGVAGNGGVIDDAGNYLGSLGVHSFTFNSVVTATDEIRIRCKSNASSGTIVLDNVTLVPITNKFIDSPAGKWFDLSGNGNVGTITNATYSSENVDVGTKYLDFDGTGDYVDFGSAIMGEVNSVATFCAWVSPSTTSGTPQDGIIGEFVNGFIFSTSSDSYGDLKLYDGTTNHLAPGGTVLGNVWSHCVITWQASGRCHMYHNGQEVYNAAVTATSFGNSPTNTRIGSVGGDYGSSSAMMNGKIATVQLYKAKLTHAQIKDMYNSQKSRFGL